MVSEDRTVDERQPVNTGKDEGTADGTGEVGRTVSESGAGSVRRLPSDGTGDVTHGRRD